MNLNEFQKITSGKIHPEEMGSLDAPPAQTEQLLAVGSPLPIPTELKTLSQKQGPPPFGEHTVDSLLSKYVSQISLTEKYEILVKEVATHSAKLLITVVLLFSILVILTAVFFSSIQHG